MEQGENKRKHLEFIQEVVKRLSGNSFLLKGWSITLVVAIITLAISGGDIADINKHQKIYLISTAFSLVIIFWILDAYYLSQERAYRSLYDEVRLKDNDKIDFSLNAKHLLEGRNSWLSSSLSKIFLVFYGSASILLLLVLSKLIGIDIYIK